MVTPFERPSVSELPFQRLLSLKYFSKVFILWKTFLRRLSLKPPFEDLVPPKSFLIILCLWKHSWMSSTSESPFNSLLSLKALLKNFVLRNPLSKHHVSERNFEGSCFLKKKTFWRSLVSERTFEGLLFFKNLFEGLLLLKGLLIVLLMVSCVWKPFCRSLSLETPLLIIWKTFWKSTVLKTPLKFSVSKNVFW